MKSTLRIAVLLGLAWAVNSAARAEDWVRFLGPNGSGVSAESAAPTEWSVEKNLAWSVDLPGFGSSSPIVVGDRLFVTCYSGYGLSVEEPGQIENLKRHLLCYDKNTGEKKWEQIVAASPEEDVYEGFITEHGYASSTPTSDGDRVYVFFGKSGVIAFDLEGNRLWHRDVGNFSDPAKWGDGSSLVLHGDLLIVNAGIVGHQIVALNKQTGEEVWSLKDEKLTNTWSTPILVEVDGRQELVFSIPDEIFGLDPQTGEKLWFAKSPISNTVCPSLASHDGVVFAMGGRGGIGIAVACGGRGDVSESHTRWQKPMRAGISTPVVAEGRLYWLASGIVNCVDCETGNELFKERLGAAPQAAGGQRRPAGDYASPIVVGDNIMLLTRNGAATNVRASAALEIVGRGSFGSDESLFNATPAVSDGAIFVRSNRFLYRISDQ